MLKGIQPSRPVVHLKFTDFIKEITVRASTAHFTHHDDYANPKMYKKINHALKKLYMDSTEFKKYFNKPALGDHQPFLVIKNHCHHRQGKEILELLQLIITIEDWQMGKKLDHLFSTIESITSPSGSACFHFTPFYTRYFSSFSLSADFIIKMLAKCFAENLQALQTSDGKLKPFSLHASDQYVHVNKISEFNTWVEQIFNFSIPHASYFVPVPSIPEEPPHFVVEDDAYEKKSPATEHSLSSTSLADEPDPDWYALVAFPEKKEPLIFTPYQNVATVEVLRPDETLHLHDHAEFSQTEFII